MQRSMAVCNDDQASLTAVTDCLQGLANIESIMSNSVFFYHVKGMLQYKQMELAEYVMTSYSTFEYPFCRALLSGCCCCCLAWCLFCTKTVPMPDIEATEKAKRQMVQQSVESFTKAFDMARAREGALTLATTQLPQLITANPIPSEFVAPSPADATFAGAYPADITSEAKQGVEMMFAESKPSQPDRAPRSLTPIAAKYQPVPTHQPQYMQQQQPAHYYLNSYQQQFQPNQTPQQQKQQYQGLTVHPYIQAQLCISIAICHSYLDNDAHKRAYITRSCEIDGESMMARAAKESQDVPSYYINMHMESRNSNINHVVSNAQAKATAIAKIEPQH
jgi:hypothetical protein